VHVHRLKSERSTSFLSLLLPECHKVLRQAANVVAIHVIFTKSAAYGKVGIGKGRGATQARHNALANRMATKILLAEDDTDMRRFLVKALQTAGYNVISFDNGLSAYQRLREEPFELLLTDIVMPEMDGIELARRAAELDPDIKIMFITGFAAVALNPDSSAPKQAKVLSKPFHLRDLVSEVGKMLAA
jgi:two-component system, cell cycle response regulator CpdR